MQEIINNNFGINALTKSMYAAEIEALDKENEEKDN